MESSKNFFSLYAKFSSLFGSVGACLVTVLLLSPNAFAELNTSDTANWNAIRGFSIYSETDITFGQGAKTAENGPIGANGNISVTQAGSRMRGPLSVRGNLTTADGSVGTTRPFFESSVERAGVFKSQ